MNERTMRVIVQKFGGTSVRHATHRQHAVAWIGRAREEGYHPVVVVSAMGREGDPYATDTLLKLVGTKAPEPRDTDLLMSCGEIIAAVVLAGHLEAEGIPAKVLTGGQAGIVTDGHFGQARILEVDPTPLQEVLAAGRVPVVAGFQGCSREGDVTTLGRGGSDTTAAALGAALKAEVVDIFTDVDGIKTADPRIVPDARTLLTVDYDELFQMANLGARVVHPRAVEIARQFTVPMRIRSTFSTSEGTLIGVVPRALDPWAHRDPKESVTGVTCLENVVQVQVRRPEGASAEWALAVFEALAAEKVSVDLINVFPDQAYFTIPQGAQSQAEAVLQALAATYQCDPDRAKVSVVGSAIHGLPGVMARVMAALTHANIPVLQSSDSHSTISFLVPREHMERAVQALHQQFRLDQDRDH